MTKPLSTQERANRRAARKAARKSNQQKAPSTTAVTVQQPKGDPPAGEDPTPSEGLNLCDTCAYEFGECEGVPKFGEEEGSDRVVECKGYANVETFPTADQGKGPDAAHDAGDKGPNETGGDQGEKPATGPRVCDVEHLRDYPECFEDCPKDECDGVPAELVHLNEDEGAEGTEEEKEEDVAVMREDVIARPDPARFAADETDYGACPSCTRSLKRTAFNRYRDAIRCTNPRCRAYRAVVKTISTGVN